MGDRIFHNIMTEPTIRIPHPDQSEPDIAAKPERTVNAVENLVSRGGMQGNPREIVQNPAVTPAMLNDSEDLRSDLTADN